MEKIIFLLLCISGNLYAIKFVAEPFKPFNYESGDQVVGPTKEILQETCNRVGINCSFKMKSWLQAYKETREGIYDGIFSISKNDEREEWMYFSHPIILTSYGFFVLKTNEDKTKTLKDFDGYTIATYGPSNLSKVLTTEISKKIKINTFIEEKHEKAFENLSKGKYNNGKGAVFFNKDVGVQTMKENGFFNLKYVFAYQTQYYYAGFNKKNITKDNFEKFNKVLADVLSNRAFVEKVSKKYDVFIAER